MAGQICSHQRVHDLFLESLNRSSLFVGEKCANFGEVDEQDCSENGELALMGGDVENMNNAFGLYVLRTNDNSPYAINNATEIRNLDLFHLFSN